MVPAAQYRLNGQFPMKAKKCASVSMSHEQSILEGPVLILPASPRPATSKFHSVSKECEQVADYQTGSCSLHHNPS